MAIPIHERAPAAAPAAPPATPDPIDIAWGRSLEARVLAPMIDTWFRARIVGAERIPERGPLILAANHSGNAFPHDAIVLDALLWRRDGLRAEAKLRTVYEPELSLVWWMRPYGVPDFWRRGGGVDMTFDNFEALLQRGDRVLQFPEGVPGIGKGFNHRYELQPFKTSFALLAARHGVPVLPVHIVNAEWVHPFGYTTPGIDRAMQRVFHVPFLPLPIGVLAIVFPFIWFLAFPAKLVFVVGQPLDVEGAMRAEGVTEYDHPPREALCRAAARVREQMQRELDACVAAYGIPRFDFRSLFRALRRAGRAAIRATPLGWPVTYLRHERDRQRPPAPSRLHAFLRDLDLAAFYLPFGWPLLTLARRLRRPPYGYRGVPAAERRAREGEFLWRLAERPLPPRG